MKKMFIGIIFLMTMILGSAFVAADECQIHGTPHYATWLVQCTVDSGWLTGGYCNNYFCGSQMIGEQCWDSSGVIQIDTYTPGTCGNMV